jgi:hypothetical protein
MDILTERGQKTLSQEAEAIAIWHSSYPSIRYFETPKDRPADVDAILTTASGKLVGVAETKCRVSITIDQFENKYKFLWLVTFDKIVRGMNVAKSLQVPLVGFLYFPVEKTLLFQKIFCPQDGLQTAIDIRRTKTQATVNGGEIYRDNAYINMENAKRLK